MTNPCPDIDYPFPFEIYKNFLDHLLSLTNTSFLEFSKPPLPNSDTIFLHIRHDIDTRRCLNNIPFFLSPEKELGLPASYFFLANRDDYSLEEAKPVVTELLELGFTVGLHTSCYTSKNWNERLADEVDYFRNTLGFIPESFTVHGRGELFQDTRIEFYQSLPDLLPFLGLKRTDCGLFYSYHFVFQDCTLSPSRTGRILGNDFFSPKTYLKPGKLHLVLIHPGHWLS